MKTNIKPLGDRVVIERFAAEVKSSGGLYLPENAKSKPQKGKVLAVGPGKKNDKGEISALTVKVGDRVLFGKWSGTEIKIDGQDLLIMKESDIMGIIEKAA